MHMNDCLQLPPAGVDALILLSGGIDSAALLVHAQQAGIRCTGLFFNYRQPHLEAERACAYHLAQTRLIPLTEMELQLPYTVDAPQLQRAGETLAQQYIAGRNNIFLAIACGIAEHKNIGYVLFGPTKDDYVGFPDCRSEWLSAFNYAQAVAHTNVTVHAPFLQFTKGHIIRSISCIPDLLKFTWSCYHPVSQDITDGQEPYECLVAVACGKCEACLTRKKAFQAAQQIDPVPYAE